MISQSVTLYMQVYAHIHSRVTSFGYGLLVSGWTSFCPQNCGIDLTRCCKHSSEVLAFIRWNESGCSPMTSAIRQAFSSRELPLTGYFLFFGPDQQFLEYSDQSGWHQKPCNCQSHLNHISSPF